MVSAQYLVGLFENNGKFEIEIIDGLPFFKVIIYNDDYKLLSYFKNQFKAGKIIERYGIKYYIISKNISTIINFFEKNKLKSKKQSICFERWRYLYNKLISEKTFHSEKTRFRIYKRLKYFYPL
jgi:hypothetical protein